MDDQEFLAQRIKDLEASVAYFAPGNKQESERWVANSFLQNLRITYSESEIVSSDDDPPDVEFRDARFEIKEILDPGRRRHDEYKQELERARSLTDPKDLLRMFTPKDSSLEEIYRLCEQVALGLDAKYPEAVRNKFPLGYIGWLPTQIKVRNNAQRAIVSEPFKSIRGFWPLHARIHSCQPAATDGPSLRSQPRQQPTGWKQLGIVVPVLS